jgi:hypothetical protein
VCIPVSFRILSRTSVLTELLNLLLNASLITLNTTVLSLCRVFDTDINMENPLKYGDRFRYEGVPRVNIDKKMSAQCQSC